MPEDADGFVPFADEACEPDNPDEWRDVCDDPTDDPHAEEDDDG